MTEPNDDSPRCACGCGGAPRLPASRWLPGHHKQRPDPIAVRCRIDPATDCWLWQGTRLHNGYGQLTYEKRRWLAHRLSWALRHGGPPADGLQLHHRCGNRACVNPDHLEPLGILAHRHARPAKLNPEAAAEIRRLRSAGLTQQAIADRFGVDRSTVSQVLRGVIWAIGRDHAQGDDASA